VLKGPGLDQLAVRLDQDPTLRQLLDKIRTRVAPFQASPLSPPRLKALLSRDGGTCPHDGKPLDFDPLRPQEHRCPSCGSVVTGERHDRHWARAGHLWFAERATDLALLGSLLEDSEAAALADRLLVAHAETYLELPNRDNVLGPTHLFFSTYLESIWITNYLAGAYLLRERELLSGEATEAVNAVADEAAFVIGEFNEGLSNRQTWHAAALTAIAAWFDDHELAENAVTSRTGLLGHLTDGFDDEGMWHEGENYHLFAIRGLMTGMFWARTLGVDLLSDPILAAHFRAALLAPAETALPDGTYPARGDARFGISLAQPSFLECWEVGRAWCGGDQRIGRWLKHLYAMTPKDDHYDAWLHDAALPAPSSRTRGDLSWWAILGMEEAPGEPDGEWMASSRFFSGQGLAILRSPSRYLSLECGPRRGGHGHPDCLHLTLHAQGRHWLPDPGTGSYVESELLWFRSPLAHNAPIVNGRNPGAERNRCAAFDDQNGWGWIRGEAEEVTRSVVSAPTHLVDVVESSAREAVEVELPWHLNAAWRVISPGHWRTIEYANRFVDSAERFEATDSSATVSLVAETEGGGRLQVHFPNQTAELIRVTCPGLPGVSERRTVPVLRLRDRNGRLAAVIDLAEPGSVESVTSVTLQNDRVMVSTGEGLYQYDIGASATRVTHPRGVTDLGGARAKVVAPESLFEAKPSWDAVAEAARAWIPPSVDGSLDGFESCEPLVLADEHQYRRSEEPYDPEAFAARAWVNWDDDALYLAVEVDKPEVLPASAEAGPFDLDNDPDDVHREGLQVYLQHQGEKPQGYVVTLWPNGVMGSRAVEWADGDAAGVAGSWEETESGYRATIRIVDEKLRGLSEGSEVGFDLIVNEIQPGRLRRAGQLVWSGGGGWVYLRGDRQDPARFGRLVLG